MKQVITVIGYIPRKDCGRPAYTITESRQYQVEYSTVKELREWFRLLCIAPRADTDFVPGYMELQVPTSLFSVVSWED